MNTTTRTALRVLVATPLAAAALTVGGVAGLVGAAHADGEPAGPGTIVLPLPDGDPQPEGPGEITHPEPGDDPQPDGPGDITNPDDGDEPGPQIPGDKDGPNQGDGPRPEGPGDIAIPDPQDKPDTPEENGGNGGHGDKDGKGDTDASVDQPRVASADVPVPTRIDAGAGAEEGLQLAWLLAGGGAVTAVGSALAGRRLVRGRH
ncbi:hypothetical protein ACJ5H2_18420 [Nocardioides sp. R1-1]|uniref:hypothetical protein n=1 Tax=Nocardioides sp. R1-1 TaxID=3383502 RepID=UPI0038D0BB7A